MERKAITWQSWMRWAWPMLYNPQLGQQSSGPETYANESGQSITDARAMQIGAVFRCIRIISEVAAALPMHGYKVSPDGDRTPLKDSHPLNGLIEEPNPVMTGDEYRETQFAGASGWGNAYSFIVPNDEGTPVELWPQNPRQVIPRRQPDRTVTYQYPDPYGRPVLYKPGEILHTRQFTIDGYMGLSPLALARESLGLTVGADRYAASFFAQGGRPAGVMTSDKLLTEAQRKQIRKEYGGIADGAVGDDHRDVENQTGKRMWILEASLKYTPVTVSPEDMQMLETRAFQVSDIARFFGVPLFLLMENAKDTSWGTGLEQMNLGFLTYTLRSYLRRMTTIWNRRIVAPNWNRVCVDIDTSPLLTMDSNALKEVYASYTGNGIMTRNEARKKLGLPQSTQKNADALTAQIALTTIDKLGTVAPPSGFPPTKSASMWEKIAAGEMP